jgi:hypothetical protein
MMCSALLAARSPPRLSLCLTVFPDDAGTGLTPHNVDDRCDVQILMSPLQNALTRDSSASRRT